MSLQYNGTAEEFYLLQDLYSEFAPTTSIERHTEYLINFGSGNTRIFVTGDMFKESYLKVHNLISDIKQLCYAGRG